MERGREQDEQDREDPTGRCKLLLISPVFRSDDEFTRSSLCYFKKKRNIKKPGIVCFEP